MDKPLTGRRPARTYPLGSAVADAVILLGTAPFLLAAHWAPRPASLVALVLLVVPFLLRRVHTGRFTRPTVLNLPVAILAFVFLPLAMLVSPAPWAITWPRVATLAWSLALFFAVVNWPAPRGRRDGRQLMRRGGPTTLFLLLGAGVALITPLGLRNVDKLFSLPQTGWLAGRLGWEQGLPTNEVAGVLTLFIPFVVALACGALWTKRWAWLATLAPLAGLLLVALALTQSRTGMVTSAIGALLALILGVRPHWRWMLLGILAAALVLVALALSPLRDWFIFAGANSWQSVIGPRLGIWSQAADGIRDYPVWGMGFGVFGSLARLVYPLVPPDQASIIEDAHNLYLQTALDLGVVGSLLVILLLVLGAHTAYRLARTQPPASLSRLWAAGLLGALVAHAFYSLTDAVALGALGGVVLWYVLGLIMGATPRRSETVQADMRSRLIPVVLAGSGLAVLGVLIVSALPVNQAGRLAAQAVLDPASATPDRALGLTDARCRAGWYEGLLYHAVGDSDRRSDAWANLLGCAPDYTRYMAVLASDDLRLARQALEIQPKNAAAHFWLAAMMVEKSPDVAIDAYRSGLALDPENGWRWLDLARLLEARDDPGAVDAFLQVCLNGDPGANGCVHAGSIAEAQGDLETALRYYRLSNWSEARERAAAVEQRLSTGAP